MQKCIKKGIEKGIQQGTENNKIEIIKNMLNMNMDYEVIFKATNKSIEEILIKG